MSMSSSISIQAMMPRTISRNKTIVICLFTAFFAQFAFGSAAYSIIIPRGKYLDVRFTSDIYPKNIHVGDTVELETASNVVIDNTIVIPEHHPVRAVVSKLQKRGSFGRPDIIVIKIDHLTMSGNVTVPLKGEYKISGQEKQAESLGITVFFCLLGIFIRGDQAYIKADTIVPCFVTANVSIDLE